MNAQCRGTTLLDGEHDFQLPQTQMVTLSISPSGTIGAENIRYL